MPATAVVNPNPNPNPNPMAHVQHGQGHMTSVAQQQVVLAATTTVKSALKKSATSPGVAAGRNSERVTTIANIELNTISSSSLSRPRRQPEQQAVKRSASASGSAVASVAEVDLLCMDSASDSSDDSAVDAGLDALMARFDRLEAALEDDDDENFQKVLA